MKILITGLCLHGNKGGAALACSLSKVLKTVFDEVCLVFAVPDNSEFEEEIRWAKLFGFECVRYLEPFDYLYKAKWDVHVLRKKIKLNNKISEVDLIIDMSALSYVGNSLEMATYQHMPYYMSKLNSKKYIRWTQTYGPFESNIVRLLAKSDLSSQPIIFCRGEKCEQMVQSLLKDCTTHIYPDIATILDYSFDVSSIKKIEEKYQIQNTKFVSITPNAKLGEKNRETGLSQVEFLNKIVDYIADSYGLKTLIVPHAFYLNLKNGDMLIAKELEKNCNVISVITGDLPPEELKTIFSMAFVHIGARYHSVIGALSSGTPTLSLSWHFKYEDIMKLYGLEKFVWDFKNGTFESLLFKIKQLIEENKTFRTLIKSKQNIVEQLIYKNVESFNKSLSLYKNDKLNKNVLILFIILVIYIEIKKTILTYARLVKNVIK